MFVADMFEQYSKLTKCQLSSLHALSGQPFGLGQVTPLHQHSLGPTYTLLRLDEIPDVACQVIIFLFSTHYFTKATSLL
jgi:hypothetical protein